MFPLEKQQNTEKRLMTRGAPDYDFEQILAQSLTTNKDGIQFKVEMFTLLQSKNSSFLDQDQKDHTCTDHHNSYLRR